MKLVFSNRLLLSIAIIGVLVSVSILAIPVDAARGRHPMVLQGHSPIVLLLTDPNGNQIGCLTSPCKSSSSPNFVNTIPSSEGPARYIFDTNQIYIGNPISGQWSVKYTGTGLTQPEPFTITATSCVETTSTTSTTSTTTVSSGGGIFNGVNARHPCRGLDDDDKQTTITLTSGTVSDTQTGTVFFFLNSDGSITTGGGSSIVGASAVPLFGLAALLPLGRTSQIKKKNAGE